MQRDNLCLIYLNVFIVYVLGTGHCSRYWHVQVSKTDKNFCPSWSLNSSGGGLKGKAMSLINNKAYSI